MAGLVAEGKLEHRMGENGAQAGRGRYEPGDDEPRSLEGIGNRWGGGTKIYERRERKRGEEGKYLKCSVSKWLRPIYCNLRSSSALTECCLKSLVISL
jgi:hypothetical protein